MSREAAPGGLDVVPFGVAEALLQQEALRYRAALIEVERVLSEPANISVAARAYQARDVARIALDAGEDAAG